MITLPRPARVNQWFVWLGIALSALMSARAIAAPRARVHAAPPASLPSPRIVSTNGDTLAWVDGHAITADDLRRRIELMPWPVKHGNASLDSARVKALESLVAEQLLAEQARREGLDQSNRLVRTREALRKTLVRDALYHDIARGGADPTAAGISRAMIARTPGRSALRTAALRRVVADSLRQLSTGVRARSFMEQTLVGRRATVDSVSLLMLADTLRTLMATTTRESGSTSMGAGEFADLLLERLGATLDRPLVRMSDGDMTLGDCIGTMRFYPFTLHARARRDFAAELSARLKEMVEGEQMTREALRRGLANDPEVVGEVDRWTTAWLAELMLERAASSPAASRDEAIRWLAREQPERARDLFEVDVAEVLSETRARALLERARLEAGANLDSLASRETRRMEWSARGGRSGFFGVAAHPRLGMTALLSAGDTLIGPVPLPEGYSVFRVLARRVRPDSADAAAPLIRNALGRATAAKRADALAQAIAALAARSRLRIDYAALRNTPIVPANMVTKRMIGFGGGMMAAPMLVPLWSWVGYWRNASIAP